MMKLDIRRSSVITLNFTPLSALGIKPWSSSWCLATLSLRPVVTLSASYLFTYLLTYSMEQSPSWEANWFTASQEIPLILCNPKVYCRIHKCPSPVSILSQLNPVHTPTFHFLKIHLNIIPLSTSGSPQWSLSLRFHHQNPVHASPLPHPSYMTRPSHFSLFCHPHNSGWGVQIIKLLIMSTSILLNSWISRLGLVRSILTVLIRTVM
jgi:hypothetical protein